MSVPAPNASLIYPEPIFSNQSHSLIPIPLGIFLSVQFVTGISAIINFLSSVLCICCMIYLDMHRKPISRIMIHVFIAGIILSMSSMYALTHWGKTAQIGAGCDWQTIWGFAGNWTMGFWNCLIGIVLARRVVFNIRLTSHFEKVSIGVIYPLSFVPALLGIMIYPTTWAAPVLNGAGCFISDNFSLARSLFQHLFMGLCMIFIILVYSFLAWYVHSNSVLTAEDEQNSSKLRTIRRLAIFPWIFFALWVWIPITRTIQSVDGTVNPSFLIFSLCFSAWLPTVNAIWFLYSRDIPVSLKDKISKSFSTTSSEREREKGSTPNPAN